MGLGGDKPQHGPLLVDPFQQQPLLIRWDWKTWLRDSYQTEENWRRKVQFHWGGGVNRGEKTGMCAVQCLVHSSEMVQQALLLKAPSYHIPGPPGPLAALIITPDLSFPQEPGDYLATWLLARLDHSLRKWGMGPAQQLSVSTDMSDMREEQKQAEALGNTHGDTRDHVSFNLSHTLV